VIYQLGDSTPKSAPILPPESAYSDIQTFLKFQTSHLDHSVLLGSLVSLWTLKVLQGLTQGQLEKPVLRKISFGGYCQLGFPTGCILVELSRCELLADFRRHLLHHGLDACECLTGSRLTLATSVHHEKSSPIIECVQRERYQGDNLQLHLKFM